MNIRQLRLNGIVFVVIAAALLTLSAIAIFAASMSIVFYFELGNAAFALPFAITVLYLWKGSGWATRIALTVPLPYK